MILTVATPPVRPALSTVISELSIPPALRTNVIVQAPISKLTTAPSSAAPEPIPRMPRSTAAVELFRAMISMSSPSSTASLMLIPVPSALSAAVSLVSAESRSRISCTLLAELRSISTAVSPSVSRICRSSPSTVVTPRPRFNSAKAREASICRGMAG